MELPSLSVIIPNYNHGHHLPTCLASVMSQSVSAKEVIIIDDGSTDDSVKVIEKLAQQYPLVKLVKNEKNCGILRTINRGIDICQSEYFTSLGADDQVMPGFFEKALTLLSQHKQAALCGAVCEFDDLGRGLKYYYGLGVCDQPRYFTPEQMVERSREGKFDIFATPMVMRRAALIEVGKFYPELKWCSDWFTAWTSGYKHGVCFVPEVLGQFQKYSTSYSGKGMQKRAERIEIYRGILDKLALPEYAEAADRIRRAAAFASFGKEMLWLIIKHKQYRHYLNRTYFLRAAWWSLRAEVKALMPNSVARICLKLAGYTAQPRSSSTNSKQAIA